MAPKVSIDLARLSAVGVKPTLKRVEKLYPEVSRVWATYPYESANFARDMSALFNGTVAVVDGTIRRTNVDGVLSAVVVPRRERMSYTDETIKTHELALTQKDTFIDLSKQLWDRKGDQLVARNANSLEKAFANRPIVSVDARLYSDEAASVGLGDLVLFVNKDGKSEFASFIGGPDCLVLPLTATKAVAITEKAILDSVEHAALQPEIMLKGSWDVETAAGLERLTTYLRRVYHNFPEFWKIWQDKINDAAKQFNPA